MANTVGALAVSLGLDAAEYIAGLSKSEYEAQKTTRAISASLDKIGASFSNVARLAAGVFGVHEIKQWAEGILEGAEQLGKLSIETGSSIEDLSKLENVAKISGDSFESFKGILDKFAASMGGTDEKSTQVGEALKLLGVNARDPATALLEAAQKLNQFADGANKAALARVLFGKSGVAFIDTLKAIAENGDVVATKTKEQVTNATELLEAYRRLGVEGHKLRDIFLEEIVPSLTDAIKRFVDARRAADDLADGLRVFSNINPFTSASSNIEYFDSEIKKIEKTIADVKASAGGLWASLAPSSQDTSHLESELALLKKGRDVVIASRLREVGGAPTNALIGGPKPDAPALPQKGQADAAARKILEGQLRDLRAASEEEKAILAARNEAVSGYYDLGLISTKDYFAARKDALAEDARNTAANYAAEADLLRKRIATPGISEPDRADAQNKLLDATRKQTLARITESSASFKGWVEEQKAAEAYRHSIDDITASVLELQGKTAEANALRLKNQQEDQRRTLARNVETGTPEEAATAKTAIAGLDYLDDQKKKQDQFSESALKYGDITHDISIAQAKLDLVTQTGLQSEIDGYKAKADLANKYIAILTAQADAQQKIAESMGEGRAKIDALKGVEDMRLGIEQLKQSADGLKIKLDGVFTSGLTTFLDDITGHTKSVSQAFKDMGKSIGDTLLHMVNEQIAKQLYSALFGGSGLGQSPGGALASLLGGGGGAGGELANLLGGGPKSGSGGGGGIGGLGGLIGSGIGGLAKLFSGGLDNAEITAKFAEWISSFGGGLIGPAGAAPELLYAASGTNYSRGGLTMVGERGPEIMNVPKGAQIIPNHVLAGMRDRKQHTSTFNQTINVLPGASRQSASQASAAAAYEARRAQTRLS